MIDIDGNVLIEPTYEYNIFRVTNDDRGILTYTAYPVRNHVIKAQDHDSELYGFIDNQGNWVIPAQYENLTSFSGEGDDAVAVANNTMIIDRNGKVIFDIANQQ